MKSDRSIEDLIMTSEVEQKRIRMYESLRYVVELCGGDWYRLEKELANGMTVYQLINVLGQNDIRFIYTKEDANK